MTKLGLDSVALLVLNVFNAYIGLDDIRPDIQYNAQVLVALLPCTAAELGTERLRVQANHWQSQEHPGHVIAEGDLVCFTVLRYAWL